MSSYNLYKMPLAVLFGMRRDLRLLSFVYDSVGTVVTHSPCGNLAKTFNKKIGFSFRFVLGDLGFCEPFQLCKAFFF